MSAFSLAPQSFNVEPAAPRRAMFWYALVEIVTWLFLIGMVSTVSAGRSGSSAYTLAVAAAGIVVSFIRRGGTRRQTLYTTLTELLTLFLVVGVASNPVRNGLTAIVVALAAWVAIEAVRAAFWQSATVIGALVQIALLVGVGLAVDGRSGVWSEQWLPLVLVAWAVTELIRLWFVRLLARWRPFSYSLTGRQTAAVVAVSGALLLALIASTILNYTTVRYHGQTVSMASLQTGDSVPYCITYTWKVAGLNLSAIGLGGPMECFDTETELRQAAATHDWVARRGFSDE